MKMVEVNWRPTDRQLRQFGGIALIAFPLAAWLLCGRPWPADIGPTQTRVIGGAAAMGVVCGLLSLVSPQLLRPLFVGLSIVALPIGLVVSEIILLVMFYLLFVPVGLFFRLTGRDAMERKIDRQAKTYWQPKAPPAGLESYFRQS